MRVIDIDAESILRLRKAEIVSRHLEAEKKASKGRSRPVQTIPQEERAAADPSPSPQPTKKWTTKLSHPTWHLVADLCPNCEFPEAMGGYCPECGWSLPHPFRS